MRSKYACVYDKRCSFLISMFLSRNHKKDLINKKPVTLVKFHPFHSCSCNTTSTPVQVDLNSYRRLCGNTQRSIYACSKDPNCTFDISLYLIKSKIYRMVKKQQVVVSEFNLLHSCCSPLPCGIFPLNFDQYIRTIIIIMLTYFSTTHTR